MTREEALNKVRQMNLPKETMEILQALAPELAESEDERIRKALIEVFKKKFERGFEWVEYGIPNRSVLDWLEKQKEQKPAEWSEEDEFSKILNLVYKAIRKVLANFRVYSEDEELLDSREESIDYYSQRCAEEILKSLRPSWKPSEEELGRKHLEGYCMGREDTLREMKDFIESHFNCENAKKGTPIVYNTQSGTSTLKAEG